MAPKISVVIPVYNVEQYLRQCLDSVVNQTMREIQIICVNDGSPDNSLAILREYADRDSRIEIIDKPNGGLSSARNAAYPLLTGKYTLFVDSDDWIDLDLCEKTHQKAEKTGAEMTAFFYQEEGGRAAHIMFRTITPEDKTTVEEKLPVLNYPVAWGKLWRTDFLLDKKLYFPDGLVFEDNLFNWKAVTLADKISVVPERFYHYRCNPDSITQKQGDHVLHVIPIYNKILEHLFESGNYAAYRDEFIKQKLGMWHYRYSGVPKSMKARYRAMIQDSLNADDREFYRTASEELLWSDTRRFYAMIDGDLIATVNYYVLPVIYVATTRVKRCLPPWFIKWFKKLLRR